MSLSATAQRDLLREALVGAPERREPEEHLHAYLREFHGGRETKHGYWPTDASPMDVFDFVKRLLLERVRVVADSGAPVWTLRAQCADVVEVRPCLGAECAMEEARVRLAEDR